MTENSEAYSVPITLAGTEFRLAPTKDAHLALSRAHGGIVPLQQRMLQQDFDALTDVILAGLGKLTDAPRASNPPGPARSEVQDALFAEGITTPAGDLNVPLLAALDAFVSSLMNGGRAPAPAPRIGGDHA